MPKWGGLETGRPYFVQAPAGGVILTEPLARMPNPLAPTGSFAEALSLFIDQSAWMDDYQPKDAVTLQGVSRTLKDKEKGRRDERAATKRV